MDDFKDNVEDFKKFLIKIEGSLKNIEKKGENCDGDMLESVLAIQNLCDIYSELVIIFNMQTIKIYFKDRADLAEMNKTILDVAFFRIKKDAKNVFQLLDKKSKEDFGDFEKNIFCMLLSVVGLLRNIFGYIICYY